MHFLAAIFITTLLALARKTFAAGEPFDNYILQMSSYLQPALSPLPLPSPLISLPPPPPTAQLSFASPTFAGFSTFAPVPNTNAVYSLSALSALPQQQQQQQQHTTVPTMSFATTILYTEPVIFMSKPTLYRSSTAFNQNIFSRSLSADNSELESLDGDELEQEHTGHNGLDRSDAKSKTLDRHVLMTTTLTAVAAAGLALIL
ncbi:hypothetical protein FB639_004682 [Coemansia asiatica]|nr:hypothetical protein FB639_004682 [Coemansia asiatica]